MLGVFDVGGEGFDDGLEVGVDVCRDTFSGGGNLTILAAPLLPPSPPPQNVEASSQLTGSGSQWVLVSMDHY